MGFLPSIDTRRYLAHFIEICQYPLVMKLIEAIEACCPSPGDPPLSAGDAEVLASGLRALADPARLRILSQVADLGEACVCWLTGPLGLSQPTVSHHLKVLHDAGFLRREKRGTWAYYSIDPDAIRLVRLALEPFAARATR